MDRLTTAGHPLGTAARWIAFHVHWPGRLEPVLLEVVAPVVAELEEDRRIDGFFFIRYWEGGQHLRLRLALAAGVGENEIEAWVGRELGRRLKPLLPAASAPRSGSLAAGAILRRPYEPETSRYGGPSGLALAERNFDASSRMVLGRLSELTSPGAMLGTASAALTLSVRAFGLDRGGAVSFLRGVADDGLWHLHGPTAPDTGRLPDPRRLKQAFADGYVRQRKVLAPRLNQIWEAAVEDLPRAFGNWNATQSATAAALLRHHRDGTLAPPPAERWPDGRELAAPCAAVAGVLFDLLHMTNNRLGLRNHEETYLAWLVARALEEGATETR